MHTTTAGQAIELRPLLQTDLPATEPWFADITGSIAFVVDPALRRHGIGRSMIIRMLAQPELASVRMLEAGVDPENLPSIRCLSAAGFQPSHDDPDFEGMLYFLHAR